MLRLRSELTLLNVDMPSPLDIIDAVSKWTKYPLSGQFCRDRLILGSGSMSIWISGRPSFRKNMVMGSMFAAIIKKFCTRLLFHIVSKNEVAWSVTYHVNRLTR